MKMGSNAVREADNELKKARSALKTGMFKWSPDYISASTHYENAAKLF